MAYRGRPSEEFYDAGLGEILVTEKSPPKLSLRGQQRLLVRNIKKLRENNPSFSFPNVMKDSGASPQMFPSER